MLGGGYNKDFNKLIELHSTQNLLNIFNMTKNNPNLSAEQKLILFEEGTERPGSSELNYEKERFIIVQIVGYKK